MDWCRFAGRARTALADDSGPGRVREGARGGGSGCWGKGSAGVGNRASSRRVDPGRTTGAIARRGVEVDLHGHDRNPAARQSGRPDSPDRAPGCCAGGDESCRSVGRLSGSKRNRKVPLKPNSRPRRFNANWIVSGVAFWYSPAETGTGTAATETAVHRKTGAETRPNIVD